MLFFLLIIGIFLSIKKGNESLAKKIGIVWLCLSIPISLVLINYIILGKEIWTLVILILALGLFLIQLLLDFVFEYDFRGKWQTHVPYIIYLYVVSFGFIFITITIDPILGWIVSFCFWGFLGTVIYLYAGKRKSG